MSLRSFGIIGDSGSDDDNDFNIMHSTRSLASISPSSPKSDSGANMSPLTNPLSESPLSPRSPRSNLSNPIGSISFGNTSPRSPRNIKRRLWSNEKERDIIDNRDTREKENARERNINTDRNRRIYSSIGRGRNKISPPSSPKKSSWHLSQLDEEKRLKMMMKMRRKKNDENDIINISKHDDDENDKSEKELNEAINIKNKEMANNKHKEAINIKHKESANTRRAENKSELSSPRSLKLGTTKSFDHRLASPSNMLSKASTRINLPLESSDQSSPVSSGQTHLSQGQINLSQGQTQPIIAWPFAPAKKSVAKKQVDQSPPITRQTNQYSSNISTTTTPIGRLISSHAKGQIRTLEFYFQTITDMGEKWGQISSLFHIPQMINSNEPPKQHHPIIMPRHMFVTIKVNLTYFSIPPAEKQKRTNMPDNPITGTASFNIVCAPFYNRNLFDEKGNSLQVNTEYSCVISKPNKKVFKENCRRSIISYHGIYFEAEVFCNTKDDLLKLKTPESVVRNAPLSGYSNVSDIYYLDMRVGYKPNHEYDFFYRNSAVGDSISSTSSVGDKGIDYNTTINKDVMDILCDKFPSPSPLLASNDYRLYWTAQILATYHEILQ